MVLLFLLMRFRTITVITALSRLPREIHLKVARLGLQNNPTNLLLLALSE